MITACVQGYVRGRGVRFCMITAGRMAWAGAGVRDDRGMASPDPMADARALQSAAPRATVTTADGFVWLDLVEPTADEFAPVARLLSLPRLAVEDAVTDHERPKIEGYPQCLFAILKPVTYVDHEEVVEIAELDLFVAADFVVTVRHGKVPVVDQAIREFADRARDESDQREDPVNGTLGILHLLADRIVDDYAEALAGIDEDIDEIEAQVFADAEASDADHSVRIYKLKREIAEFRHAIAPLIWGMRKFMEHEHPALTLTEQDRHYFRDVIDHILRTVEEIETHDRLLSDILQADFARLAARQSQISVRQNEIAVQQNQDMRRISAWAALGLVPTAIAGIYGMNFQNMPELRWHYGYFMALGLILALCAILFRAFRRNGWL